MVSIFYAHQKLRCSHSFEIKKDKFEFSLSMNARCKKVVISQTRIYDGYIQKFEMQNM